MGERPGSRGDRKHLWYLYECQQIVPELLLSPGVVSPWGSTLPHQPVLCLGCQGLPCLQWMLSLGIAQLGCADTAHETNASSYIQGYTERENERTDKTTFCLLIFHCVPFSRKKVFLSFFQGSDVSKIQCPKNWSKSFALRCMAALERKRLQPEKRDWDTMELVVVVGHPSVTAKAGWVTKAKVELTAYSIYCFWQIIINITVCLEAST